MLGAIETLVISTIRTRAKAAALKIGDIVAGQGGRPDTGTRLAVWARSVNAVAGDSQERGVAHALNWASLSPDAGNPLNFTIPDGTGGIDEVVAADGRSLRPGESYVLDGAKLRFFTAPAAPLRLTTRGGPVRGYVEKTPARVELCLNAWGADADGLLALASGSALAAFLDQGAVGLSQAEAAGFRLRLLKPVARLEKVERPEATFASAVIGVSGELELTLALGDREPDSVIGAVQPAITVLKG